MGKNGSLIYAPLGSHEYGQTGTVTVRIPIGCPAPKMIIFGSEENQWEAEPLGTYSPRLYSCGHVTVSD